MKKLCFNAKDKLVQLCGGFEWTEPLSFGADADQFSEEQELSGSKSETS